MTESILAWSDRWTRQLALATKIRKLLASALRLDSQAQPFFVCMREKIESYFFLSLCDQTKNSLSLLCSVVSGMCLKLVVILGSYYFYFYFLFTDFIFCLF